MLPRGSFVALALSLVSSVSAISPGFPYGSEKVRGVNLGGWLVLEPWITPSLFDNTGNNAIVDEWTFCEFQSPAVAEATLQAHWSTWITESDFAAIAAAGLNHVRLPIGYWAWDVSGGEPFIQGQADYLNTAVGWAGKHGLKVIIDLHGAPGSQNGFDNSGERLNAPTWHTQDSYIDRTNTIIQKLASQFAGNPSVVPIIAPLNEPAGFYNNGEMLSTIKNYWYNSFGNIRWPYGTSQQSNTLVLIHDAFMGLSYWDDFMTGGDSIWPGVAMDIHIYQMFTNAQVAYSYDQHISAACAQGSSLSSFHLWTIVGEWTPAPTDCAKYLNGRGRDARYDGTYDGAPYTGSCVGMTGSGATFSSDYKTFLRKYWEAQTITYEQGAGWVQWTWKAEQADDWSYQAGLQYGWIPQNPNDRQYPTICG